MACRGLKNENISNKQLAEQLQNQLLENLIKRKCNPLLWIIFENIWSADLADMQLINRFNKRFRFLLCIVDIYSKYACAIPLKNEKGITITNAFQKI